MFHWFCLELDINSWLHRHEDVGWAVLSLQTGCIQATPLFLHLSYRHQSQQRLSTKLILATHPTSRT